MNFLFLDTLGYESALRLSGHHYASLLVKRGHRVLSLSAPVTPWHRLSRSNREAIRRRFEAHRSGFSPAPGGAEHYVPHSWIPVRNRWPFDRNFVPGLAARFYRGDVLARLEAKDFVPDVISLQNLMFYPLARHFPDAILQYRMTDYMAAFEDYPACLARLEARVLDEADLISVTSRQFLAHLTEAQQEKALYAPNGVDIDHFSRPRPRPAAFEAMGRPIVVYIGALREGFDWELIRETAELMPEAHFVMISPDRPREDFRNAPRFTYIPGVPYEDVPAYYQHADATIIPFADLPLVAPVNPIKMFESLAAGTPVVTSGWSELRKLGAPVRQSRDAPGFAAALREAIDAGSSAKPSYTDFLSQYSWEGNLDRMLERIHEIGARKFAPKA